ncbi:hypothetical protein CANARDRAFT_8506 [[Candida] arabinofermentans NRRL YB-2248]|uniref:Striatin N-terminal domain-containing protein n=1 Tax=[Candida] arabinofermentans NRRL YB-2248 TaxID=983967 RepID=A0A1E4SYH1_9ASCO|nr:hypothetical protein CANARDRAFT_8506 [[Candida] arabinofermentans NRRL YB-2248]
MDQLHFGGGSGGGVHQNSNSNGGLPNDQMHGANNQGQRYTLPGIMQYLQSQFTLIEKNRMLNDLEKSSLKLKIVELESERNSLKLQNEKLNLKVEQLSLKVESLEKKTEPQSKNGESETGLLKSLTRGRSRNGKSNPIPTSTSNNNELSDDNDPLMNINTIDVSKLVKARQFLKSATSEILYMLKSPTLELTDPINLLADQSDQFYVDPSLHSRNISPLHAQSNNSNQSSNDVDSNYVDMAISLAPPFKSRAPQPSNLTDSEEEQVDVSSIDLESDAETVIESSESTNTKQEIKKPLTLLKRNTGSDSKGEVSIPVTFNPTDCKMIYDLLLCYSAEQRSVEVWKDIMTKKSLLITVSLPTAFNKMVDMFATDEYVVVASPKELLVYIIPSIEPSLTYEFDTEISGIDFANDKILVTLNTTVEILQIVKDNCKLQPLFTANYGSELKSAKFLKDTSKFDISILTSDSLILQNTRQSPSLSQTESSQNVPITTKFTHYLLTSSYVILEFEIGPFLMSLSDLNGFKAVPVAFNTHDLNLQACTGNHNLFYNVEITGSKTVNHQIFTLVNGNVNKLKSVESSVKSDQEFWFIVNDGEMVGSSVGKFCSLHYQDGALTGTFEAV